MVSHSRLELVYDDRIASGYASGRADDPVSVTGAPADPRTSNVGTTCRTVTCASYHLANAAAGANERVEDSLKSTGQRIAGYGSSSDSDDPRSFRIPALQWPAFSAPPGQVPDSD